MQKTVDKVLKLYMFWSAALLAIFIFMESYRMEAFYTWWILTAVLILYLLINILHLVNLKKKLSEDKLKELIYERNKRFSRSAGRISKRMEDES